MRMLPALVLAAAMLHVTGCGVNEQSGDVGPLADASDSLDSNQFDDADSGRRDTNGPDEGGPPVSVDGPSAELLVRITGPTGKSWATTAGTIISLTGLVFGKHDTITWKVEGGETGDAIVVTGSPYWQTDAIPLERGDNRIVVTATSETETASDTIMVTSNPGYLFAGSLEVLPPTLFEGQSEMVLATISLGALGGASLESLTLTRASLSGGSNEDLSPMLDDGQVAISGDEIEGDGLYSAKVTLSCSTLEPFELRAVARVKGADGGTWDALSAPVRVHCLRRLGRSECASRQKLLADAREAYKSALATGSTLDARLAALDVLGRDAKVAEKAGDSEVGGVWVRWIDGMVGAINVPRENTRGGDGESHAAGDQSIQSVTSFSVATEEVRSKKTLLMSPFADSFAPNDEAQFIANVAFRTQCPAYSVVGPLNGAAASVHMFRRLSEFGIVALATHGDIYFTGMSAAVKQKLGWRHAGGQEILWAGETVNCGNLAEESPACSPSNRCPAGSECILNSPGEKEGDEPRGVCLDRTQTDLMTGRIVLGDRTYGITPAFFDFYAANRPFPGSLVYLGACRTLYNGTLAASLFAAGARTIAGFSNIVSSEFAYRSSTRWFGRLIEQQLSTGQAYGVGDQDPDNQGSFFRLFGGRSLSISDYSLLNSSFETSDLSAWTADGDGRVVPKLGKASPVSGKFMGIISTGMGFTINVGSVQQRFCLRPGATTLSFYWKLYSEEFREFCGTAFQDTFEVRLKDTRIQVQPISVIQKKIDHLCEEGDGCCEPDVCKDFPGGSTECGLDFVGLERSDVQFDKGNVWMTGWQKMSFDLGDLSDPERPVPLTLEFRCTDRGDSIYDTAVLIDDIRVE